jgi:hypothetical protein
MIIQYQIFFRLNFAVISAVLLGLGQYQASFAAATTMVHDLNGNMIQIASVAAAKPVISTQPVDWSGTPGSTAVFFVRTAPNAANAYQWKKGAANIVGATLESLPITNVSAADEALYSVVITNSKGSVTSRAARLALDTDNDGLADADETRLFAGLGQTGVGDFDHDGVTNAEEIADGTDPKLGTSLFFRLTTRAEHGSITVTPPSVTGRYKLGTKVTLTARADAGYAFTQWQGAVSSLAHSLVLTMTSHMTETAVFASDLAIALDAPDFNWQTGGLPSGWFSQRIVTIDGRSAAQSSTLPSGGNSWVSTYVQGPATVSFWWMLPTASSSSLKFNVDGVLNSTAAANGTWTQVTVTLADGVHDLQWALTQPVGAPVNAKAWLDRVVISNTTTVPLPQALETTTLNWATDRMNPWFGVASTTASHDGTDAALGVLDGQYRSSWMETYVTGAGTIEFWWRESGVNMTLLVDGVMVLSASSSWSFVSYTVTGAGPHHLRWVTNTDYDNYAIPEYGSGALDQVNWMPAPAKPPVVPVATYTFGQAVGSTLAFQTGGKAVWTIVTDQFSTGPAALASGVIANNADSWIETRIAGPGNLTFYTKVDSESAKDLYTVSLDGVVQFTRSGSGGWLFQTLAIPVGNHTVRWRYAKDAANKSGLDRAWLDTVVFTPTVIPVPTTPPALGGPPVPAIADAVDNTALSYFSGGTAVCTVDTTTTHDTVDAMKSGLISHSQETWFETVLDGPGTLGFWWKVSSESGFDFLRLEIDGVQNSAIAGTVDWVQKSVVISTSGLHKVRWRYSKDGSVSTGSDAGWVDEVTWTGASGGVGGGLAAYPAAIFAPAGATNQIINIVGTGAWTATESLPWASFTGATSGNDAGTVTLALLANTGAVRQGNITVAGQTISVQQESVQKPVIGLSFTTATVTVGSSFTATPSSYNYPTLFKAAGLAPGLSISATTGAITGIVTVPGTYTVSITASNVAGSSNTVKFTLKANPLIYTLGTGKAFATTPAFPHAPNKFAGTGLPAGVTVSVTTGFVSGSPLKPGTYAVTITGTNAAKLSVPFKFTMIVTLPVFIGGKYDGLVERHATLNGGFGGLVTLAITATGGVTGTTRLGSVSWPLAGSLLVDTTGGGKIAISVVRKNLTPLLLNLTFDPGRNFGFAEGTVADSASPANTAAVRVWCNRWIAPTTAAAFAGYYTNALNLPTDEAGNVAVPQGTGYLNLAIGANGSVAWTGKTADGEPLTGSSTLWPTGEIPIFTMLYKNTGSMIGLPAVTPAGDCSGRIDWIKVAPQPVAVRSYRTGFGPLAMSLQGRRWVAPASGQIIFNLPDAANNARLDFTQGSVETAAQFADLDQLIRISKTNTVLLPASVLINPTGVKLTLNTAKGTFSGSFKLTDGAVPRAVTFEGVLLSGESLGRGAFQLPKLPLGNPANSDIMSGNVILSPVVVP